MNDGWDGSWIVDRRRKKERIEREREKLRALIGFGD
jgi:hypothetical protein